MASLNHASGSDWGGTTIEAWLPNTTFTDANPKCKGSTGNVTGPQAGVNGGELFNGMMMPFSRMAVAGALWYRKRHHLLDLIVLSLVSLRHLLDV